MRSLAAVLAFAFLMNCGVAFAATPIGNGLSCDGNVITKGSKTVTFSKAKSNLKTTLAKLKASLQTAPLKKKPGIQAKINSAKQTQVLIKSCNSGSFLGVVSVLAAGTGKFSGNYSGQVSSLLGNTPITGTVETLFEIDGTVFTGTLGLGGNLGSALNAQPLVFSQDIAGVGYPLQVVITQTFIGDVTLTITEAGHITIVNSNYGGTNAGPIEFQGDYSFTAQQITAALNGSYGSGLLSATFSGTATLTKTK